MLIPIYAKIVKGFFLNFLLIHLNKSVKILGRKEPHRILIEISYVLIIWLPKKLLVLFVFMVGLFSPETKVNLPILGVILLSSAVL